MTQLAMLAIELPCRRRHNNQSESYSQPSDNYSPFSLLVPPLRPIQVPPGRHDRRLHRLQPYSCAPAEGFAP